MMGSNKKVLGGPPAFGRGGLYPATTGGGTEPPTALPPIRVTIPSLIRSRPSSCKRQPQMSVVRDQADEELMRNIKALEYRS